MVCCTQVFDWGTLHPGQTFNVTVKSQGGPFIACLVWYDYPAAVSAAVSLVNDLE
jgi:hypothetical protein